MEEQLTKLRAHTKEIYDIMLLAQSSFRIVDYLYREREGLEIEVINQNQFLKYTAEMNWRIYVIELSKLFSDRDSDWFNLKRFIQKFKKGYEYNKIKEIDNQSILYWEQNLALEKRKIDNLILQRDKLYSHTDKNRAKVKNELSFSDAKELIQIVQRIVSEIYNAVFDTNISFEPIGEPIDDLKKIVQALVDKKKEMIDFYKAHCKEQNIDPKFIGLT